MSGVAPIVETFEAILQLLVLQRDQARADQAQALAERDQARDMCARLEHAIYKLGAWDPTNPLGREMIREDLERGGAASIERSQ